MRRAVFAGTVGLSLALSGAGARAQAPAAAATAPAAAIEGEESPELRELRLAEIELFGAREPLIELGTPRVRVGEMPSALTSDAPEAPSRPARGSADLAWMQNLELPDLPVRWDDRVVRFLEFFRNDPRGRNLMGAWLRRSHRYGSMVRAKLREMSLPEDILYVAMVESGFDPTAQSHASAVGMWQFVRATGQQYGLERDHWVDERMDPVEATGAAARFLSDLHRRFGSWELALAAYNMGYGALLRAIRKYNTNDFWVLAELEAGLPFETTIYVAKIMAAAIVGRNPERFGFGDIAREPELSVASVEVPGGTPLGTIARAAGTDVETLKALNPQLRRTRVPPGATYAIRIPADKQEAFARTWTRVRPRNAAHQPYVVRFGETLDDIARRHRTSANALRTLNELAEADRALPGATLLVPAVEPREESPAEELPVVAVPDESFVYADRRRVFHRVTGEDTPEDIARFFGVTVDELRRWNRIDADASLVRGMILQLFVPQRFDLSRAVVLADDQVRVLVVGSEEFFEYHEAQRGRVRLRYRVQPGDTLTAIARRFGLEVPDLARINRFATDTTLRAGQDIVVYASRDSSEARAIARRGAREETTLTSARPAAATAAQPAAAAAPSEAATPASDAAPSEGTAAPGAPTTPPSSDAAPDAAPPPAADAPPAGAIPGEPPPS